MRGVGGDVNRIAGAEGEEVHGPAHCLGSSSSFPMQEPARPAWISRMRIMLGRKKTGVLLTAPPLDCPSPPWNTTPASGAEDP